MPIRQGEVSILEYVEQTSGWNEDEQRQLHQKRFASQHFQVIQVSGLDIGILCMSRQPDYIKVSQLFILPEYQSRGIGGAAMMLIIKESAASKLPIRLQVLKINRRALSFYQRLGFKRTGRK